MFRAALHCMAAFICLMTTGCAGRIALERAPTAPPRQVLRGVEFVPQTRSQCGPAALLMALRHAGADLSLEQVSRRVFTEGRGGSLPLDLVGASRRLGHIPYRLESWAEAEAAILAGHPVVVLQNLGLAWIPRWHFALLIGYDARARTVTLHTGTRAAYTLALDTFYRTWERADRWALVVPAPSDIPVYLPAPRVLASVAALERTGAVEIARSAYASAVRTWPDSSTAVLGLANTHLASGDVAGAYTSLVRGLERFPDHPLLVNNLAFVLGELGRPREGIERIEAVLAHSTAWRATLERTLAELREREQRPQPSQPIGEP